MRRKFVLALITVAVVIAIAVTLPKAPGNANTVPTPVVVELFTSEGCSSCPPADRLLLELQHQHTLENAELILLGEHVDYWNRLGWKDRFSSADFTERQRRYVNNLGLRSAYTPQAVVDGQVDVLGSDQRGLERAILRAASSPKPAKINLTWPAPDRLGISVVNAEQGRVVLAVTEDDLTTDVGGGENGGRTLHHAAVVRELRELGKSKDGTYQNDVTLNWRPDWKRSNSRVVVFVQRGDGQVLGASSLSAVPSK
jgi:hypothetical protein